MTSGVAGIDCCSINSVTASTVRLERCTEPPCNCITAPAISDSRSTASAGDSGRRVDRVQPEHRGRDRHTQSLECERGARSARRGVNAGEQIVDILHQIGGIDRHVPPVGTSVKGTRRPLGRRARPQTVAGCNEAADTFDLSSFGFGKVGSSSGGQAGTISLRKAII